jgi:phospholipid-translocating ATPase
MVWHGRNSYKRTALLSQFIIHRGMLIAIIQLIFSCCFYNVSIPIFNSILQLGYATVFTMMPVFALILDEDICQEVAVTESRLYSSLRRGREVGPLSFSSWLARACYQGATLMVLTLVLIGSSYALLETCCFTSLMITEYLMCMVEMARPHWVTGLTSLLSFLCYSWLLTFRPALL